MAIRRKQTGWDRILLEAGLKNAVLVDEVRRAVLVRVITSELAAVHADA